MQPLPVPDKQYTEFLEQWNCELVIVIYANRAWFAMRQLCAAIGVTNAAKQAATLADDGRFDGMIMQLQIQTKGGPQPSWCIEKQAIGGWLNHISHKKARAEIQPNLLRFQRDMIKLADRYISTPSDSLSLAQLSLDIANISQDVETLKHYARKLEATLGQIKERLRIAESDDSE